jgi:hypothetical protein
LEVPPSPYYASNAIFFKFQPPQCLHSSSFNLVHHGPAFHYFGSALQLCLNLSFCPPHSHSVIRPTPCKKHSSCFSSFFSLFWGDIDSDSMPTMFDCCFALCPSPVSRLIIDCCIRLLPFLVRHLLLLVICFLQDHFHVRDVSLLLFPSPASLSRAFCLIVA